MKDLRKAWKGMAARIARAPHVLVLTDYDGTLVPIVGRPDRARLTERGRRVLRALRDRADTGVGVVSGRALADVASLVALEGLWYVGNHGFEVRTPAGEEVRFFSRGDLRPLAALRRELARRTAGIPGVLLEPKGPVLAVHYRRVDPRRVPEVKRAFFELAKPRSAILRTGGGKCVLEARLRRPCSKGSAVRFIRRRCPPGTLVLYFGDDRTDADAFRALRSAGLTVAVNHPDPGLAHFVLPDPGATIEALERIDDALRDRRQGFA
jgi:trehalose-phosphatase